MVVIHPVFGEGVVIDERWGGVQLKVRFKDGFSLWIPARRLRPVPKKVEEVDLLHARRMIEAFRMGIVPSVDVKRFTFGREEIIEKLKERISSLEGGDGSAIVIEGEYGAGKTHILEYVRRLSLDMGVGVASCSFDPEEVPPHRPKRIYREIVNSLIFLDEGVEKGFRDLMEIAGEKGLLKDHVFFGPFLRKLMRTGEKNRTVLWQWAEGESTKEYALDATSPYRIKGGYGIPALYECCTAADFYCNLICGISCALRGIGKKGLVLLLDEAETISRIEPKTYLEKGWQFLEGLIGIAQKKKELTRIGDADHHNGIRPVPYIYGNPSIVVLITTTPLYEWSAYRKMKDMADLFLSLSPLSAVELSNLVSELVNIYRSAYPDFMANSDIEKKILKVILSRRTNGIRNYIKYCVEFLDSVKWTQRK